MDEKTAKILFVLGMTISFPLVLVLMVSLLDRPSPTQKTRRLLPRSEQSPPVSNLSATGAADAPVATHRDSASTRSPATETNRPSSAVVVDETPSSRQTPLQPDPVAVEQLDQMKREINQQIDALKKDRDAMILALAQSLAPLSPADAARELGVLDDRAVALALSQYSTDRRQAILSRFDLARTRSITRQLRLLASR